MLSLRRQGKSGPFLGCSGYPECSQTMDLDENGQPVLRARVTEHKCEKCGKPMVIREGDDLRIYGAGILSGPREAVFALEAQSPNRIMLNVDRVMRTDYVIDDLQPTYFVIESFDDLYHQTVERDFDRLYRGLGASFTYANSAVIDVDDVLHRGTQEYHLRGGRGSNAAPV